MSELEDFLLGSLDSYRKEQLREDIMKRVTALRDPEFTEKITRLVFRPTNELYIPIVKSMEFHTEHPNFFVKELKFDERNNLIQDTKDRTFKLRLMPSGEEIEAYINQQGGKAIQSIDSQEILGRWLLQKVFQLPPQKPLTQKRLEELGINGLRLTKATDGAVELEFIWIDEDNLPEDYWGIKSGK